MNDFDTELALKLSKIVHEKCQDAPHNIGIDLAKEVFIYQLAESCKRKIEIGKLVREGKI